MFRCLSRLSAIVCLLIVVASVSETSAADRPSAPELLPKETLAYVRIRDTQELVKQFNDTAIGQMSQEEQIKPLIADLYGSAATAFSQVEDEVGLPLEKILELPQGEIVFALVDPRQGEMAMVVIVDVGENSRNAETLIKTGEEALANEGATRTTEVYGETELVVHDPAGNGPNLVHFLKDGTFVATNNLDISKQILDVWAGKMPELAEAQTDDDGDAAEVAFIPLAENDKFTAIMKRCNGTKADPAQATFFVDPISIYRVASRGNAGAQVALAVLPVLGLDGFQGVGGSITFAAEDFDTITHLHVLLEEPRTGIIKMLAMEADDSSPEPWVPADVASYTTMNWDVEKTYATLTELYDSFRGEGQLAAEVKTRISEPLGVDFEADVLMQLGGRFTYLTWYERPARIGSEAALFGIKLEDPKAFRATFETLTDKYKENLDKKSYGNVTYWQMKLPEIEELPAEDDADVTDRQRRRAERRNQRQLTFRAMRPSPCFALMDDYLIVSDRTSFLEKIILAKSDNSNSLAKELDFKLIASKIRRQIGGGKPGFMTFSRPEEGMKVLYEMATGEETRERLRGAAEDNEFFGALNGALEKNELPPFAVLAKYLAPGGGMITSDETGFHYTGFMLKRN